MNDDIISLPNGDFYVKPRKENKPKKEVIAFSGNEIEYLTDNHWNDLELARHDGYTGEGWYFWNEAWIFVHGPYKSEDEAKQEQKEYFKFIS